MTTLIVDGDPADWLPIESIRIPGRQWVTVDELPTVTEPWEPHTADPVVIRSLWIGDTVTLAIECDGRCDPTSGAFKGCNGHPFATATVARIDEASEQHHASNYYILITDVKEV